MFSVATEVHILCTLEAMENQIRSIRTAIITAKAEALKMTEPVAPAAGSPKYTTDDIDDRLSAVFAVKIQGIEEPKE